MAGWTVEFDFVEDDTGGGKFVAASSAVGQIRALLSRGAVDQAISTYEQFGAGAAESLVEEARVASTTTRAAIADLFARARDFHNAARVMEQSGQPKKAAEFYEMAGEHALAADGFTRAGDLARAAHAHERGGRVDLALQLYQRLGAHQELAECLARQGRHGEAAGLYAQLGNVHGEVQMLQQVALTDPLRIPATKRLATLMAQHGHGAQAVSLIMETARGLEAAAQDRELQSLLIGILESLGRGDEVARIRAAISRGGEVPTAHLPGAAPASSGAAMTGSAEAYAFLKNIPMFGELALPDMKDLYLVAQPVMFPAGAILIEKGVEGRGLLVIVSGNADVLAVGDDGGTRQLNTLGAGAYAGEISLVSAATTSARVVAKTPVQALVLARERFEHFLDTHPAAALAIYRLFTVNLASRVRALSAR